MTIEEAAVNHLNTDPSLLALVEGRVYPEVATQRQKVPQIVYTVISTLHQESMEGSSGLAGKRFQFDCVSDKYSEAKAVAELLRLRMQGFMGLMGTSPNRVRVDLAEFADERDGYNDDMEMFVTQVDYLVHFEVAIPGEA